MLHRPKAFVTMRRFSSPFHVFLALAAFVLSSPQNATSNFSASDDEDIGALDRLRVPRPRNLGDFVRDEAATVALGKALFWDSQAGGDGMTACATCHFSAGTDARAFNTVNPGRNGIFETVSQAGEVLRAGDFPIQSDDIVGAQGLVDTGFQNINPGNPMDSGFSTPNATFGDNRQVTGRNTPTFINSVFNVENFWDGRAKNTFNGVHPGGRDPNAKLLRVGSGGSVSKVTVELRNSSQSSQTVGPPNNGTEMSFEGRSFFDLGKKMLSLRPLQLQEVHADDSVLGGSLRDPSGMGLAKSYGELIRAAFRERWWDSDVVVDRNQNVIRRGTPSGLSEFSLMEANFSLFWGIAIQMYGSTQISGDSPFDRFAKGDSRALTTLQRRGLDVFTDKGECTECHSGPLFTEIADGTGGKAFVHTGVRPIQDDGGHGEGEFKTSTIRNAELTGPYFHNGGYGTLRQVVEFYDRGGDFPEEAEIDRLRLSESDKVALVAFMLSTTDERVRFARAPFDHPSLDVPNHGNVAAVGRNGGVEIRPFLDLDPFDAGSGSAGLIVAQERRKLARRDQLELVLLSHAHRGERFWLFASCDGRGLELPAAGLACPTSSEAARLFATPGLTLVAVGDLDSIGAAELSLPAPPLAGGEIQYFFVVLDPRTCEVRMVSSALGIPALQ